MEFHVSIEVVEHSKDYKTKFFYGLDLRYDILSTDIPIVQIIRWLGNNK